MAEPEKKPDTKTPKSRRQGKWPKGSKKPPAGQAVSNALLLRQIEATERLADEMAESNRLKRLELRLDLEGFEDMIIPAERERSMAEVLADIDYSLFENEDGLTALHGRLQCFFRSF